MIEPITGVLRELAMGHRDDPILSVSWKTRNPEAEFFTAVNFPWPHLEDAWWKDVFVAHLAIILEAAERYRFRMSPEKPRTFVIHDTRPELGFGYEVRDSVIRSLRTALPEPYHRFKLVYATTALDVERRVLQ